MSKRERELVRIAKEIKEIKSQLKTGSWVNDLTAEEVMKSLAKYMGSDYNYKVISELQGEIQNKVLGYMQDYGNSLDIDLRFKNARIEFFSEDAGGVTHNWDLKDYVDLDTAAKLIARKAKRIL